MYINNDGLLTHQDEPMKLGAKINPMRQIKTDNYTAYLFNHVKNGHAAQSLI